MVAPIVAALVKNLIGAGLGTLAGAVAQKGQEFVEEKLGVDLAASIATPEGLTELRQLEFQHEEELLKWAIEDRKMDLQFYEAEVADRKSAREANVAVATSEHSGFLNRNLMPILAIGALSISLYGIIWTPTDAEVKYALVAVATQILNYFFGSSSLAWKQAPKGAKQ